MFFDLCNYNQIQNLNENNKIHSMKNTYIFIRAYINLVKIWQKFLSKQNNVTDFVLC